MEWAGEDADTVRQFGKFAIRSKLGSGGMAEVFLAEMTGPGGFGKLVALKCISPKFLENGDSIDAFISEARLGGSLNHPNIVQTLELGTERGRYYLAMEYVEGMTLSQLLRYCRQNQRYLPLQVALEIARQVSEGLDYAHRARDPRGQPLHLIHRDLKPANVLLSLFGGVKIADFGVARAASNIQQTKQGLVKGTVAYMSPEQACCEPLDPRSDLFSLGAILFEMLTLEPLYASASGVKDLPRVMECRIEDRLELLEPYPPALTRLVTGLLARDRESRPASAQELRRDLMSIIAVLPQLSVELKDLVGSVQEELSRASLPVAGPPEPEYDSLLMAASGMLAIEWERILKLEMAAARGARASSSSAASKENLAPGRAPAREEQPDGISRPEQRIQPSSPLDSGPAPAAAAHPAIHESPSPETNGEVVFRSPSPQTGLLIGGLLLLAVLLLFLAMPARPPRPAGGQVSVAPSRSRSPESNQVGPGREAPGPEAAAVAPSSLPRDTGAGAVVALQPGAPRIVPAPTARSSHASSKAPMVGSSAGLEQKPLHAPSAVASPAVASPAVASPAVVSPAVVSPSPSPRVSQAPGFLSVNSRPYTYVSVDGEPARETTPLSRLPLPAGRHTLTFRTEDGRTQGPVEVDIKAGENQKLKMIEFE